MPYNEKAASGKLAAFFVLCREPCDFVTCMVCVSACAFKPGCAMPEAVKCQSCEFLAMIHPESGERVEAVQLTRRKGIYCFSAGPRTMQYVPQLICHAGKRPIHKLRFNDDKTQLLAAITEDIECDRWTQYEPGRGLKEIDQMNVNQAMLEMQEKILALQQGVFEWRQQQADKNQKWDQQIQALQQVRHNETRGDTAVDQRWQIWLAIWLGVFGAVVSLIGVAVQVAYGR